MTDGVGIPKTGTALAPRRPDLYQGESIREVRARAGAIPQDASPEELDGLTRLRQIMRQGRPLRDDVPRGFYLNIKI